MISPVPRLRRPVTSSHPGNGSGRQMDQALQNASSMCPGTLNFRFRKSCSKACQTYAPKAYMELCSAKDVAVKVGSNHNDHYHRPTRQNALGDLLLFQDPLDLDLRSEWLRDERDEGLRFCAVVICPSSRSTLLARSLNIMSSNPAIPSAESCTNTDTSVLQRLHVVQFVEPHTMQLSARIRFACRIPWPGRTLRPAAAYSS